MRPFLRNFLLSLLLCSLVSLAALARFDFTLTGIDDANIYLVYARNVANGHGFVYNVGGEHVEGFTSLLWTLVGAGAFQFSGQPELSLLILSILILSLAIAFALDYLQTDFLKEQAGPYRKYAYSVIFLIMLLAAPRYIVWNTITLMDNCLWGALLLVLTIFVIKDHPSARAINLGFLPLGILLVLTRPESVLWGPLFLGILLARRAAQTSVVMAIRELAPSIVGLAASMVAMIAFQLAYFGYPVPNTFYAKVSPSLGYNLQQGALYLAKYAVSDPVALLTVIAAVTASLHTIRLLLSRKAGADGAAWLPFIAATGLVAPLLTGGDHFGAFRLYQNVYPIGVLCLLYFVGRLVPQWSQASRLADLAWWKRPFVRFGAMVIILVMFMGFQLQAWNAVRSEMQVEFLAADYGRKNGSFIHKLFSPLGQLPSLGVVTSGGIKYMYPGPVVDLMGLNNTLMAHNDGDRRGIKNHAAFDIPTFYKLQPDIVWPRTVLEAEWQYHETDIRESWENTVGLKGLFNEPDFLQSYRFTKVTHPTLAGYALVGWFKEPMLQQLEDHPQFQVEHYPFSP